MISENGETVLNEVHVVGISTYSLGRTDVVELLSFISEVFCSDVARVWIARIFEGDNCDESELLLVERPLLTSKSLYTPLVQQGMLKKKTTEYCNMFSFFWKRLQTERMSQIKQSDDESAFDVHPATVCVNGTWVRRTDRKVCAQHGAQNT